MWRLLSCADPWCLLYGFIDERRKANTSFGDTDPKCRSDLEPLSSSFLSFFYWERELIIHLTKLCNCSGAIAKRLALSGQSNIESRLGQRIMRFSSSAVTSLSPLLWVSKDQQSPRLLVPESTSQVKMRLCQRSFHSAVD